MVKFKNSSKVKDDLIACFIVFLFVFGFFLLVFGGSSYTGYSSGNISFSIPESNVDEFDDNLTENEGEGSSFDCVAGSNCSEQSKSEISVSQGLQSLRDETSYDFGSEAGIERKYTGSTLTNCKIINGRKVCNLVLYSGVKYIYEDDKWKPREEARSLKNKEGFNIIYLKDDGIHKIDVIDFNDTSIQLDFSYDKNSSNIAEYEYELEEGKMKTKYKIIETFYNKTTLEPYKIITEYEIEIEEDKQANFVYYGNPFGKKFSLGEHSTEIILQDANVENLEDTFLYKANPDYSVGNQLRIELITDAGPERKEIGYIKWNITSIPSGQQIDKAKLWLNVYSTKAGNISVYHGYNQSWLEGATADAQSWPNLTWNNQLCGTGFDAAGGCNLTPESTTSITSTAGWYNWSTRDMLQRDYTDENSNFTIAITTPDGSKTDGTITAHSKESITTASRPILNITYSSAPDSDAPVISLHSPYNNTNWTTPYINFTYNVSDASDIESCRLYLGSSIPLNTINSTNSSITKDINQTFNLTVQDGNFYWKVNCNDSENNYGNSSINYLTVDATTPPVINLQAPINDTRFSVNYIDFVFNVTDAALEPETCTLWLDVDEGGFVKNESRSGVVFHNQSNISSYAVGNYRFEQDSAKNYADPTIGNGSLYRGVTNTSGIVGYAYEFDGINMTFVQINETVYNNLGDNNFSYMAWVKMKGKPPSEAPGIVWKHIYNWAMQYRVTQNDFACTTYNATSTASTADTGVINLNQWYHIACVYNGTRMNIYIDGELIDFGDYLGGEMYDASGNLFIGARGDYQVDDIDDFFNGTIDEVMVFNRSLTSGEISQLYNDTNDKLNFEGYNTSFDRVTFSDGEHSLDWKVECNDTVNNIINSSIRTTGINRLVTQSKPNIGAHAYVDENYVVGQWRFEEFNTTTFKDETGLNNGTISGGVKWCPDGGDSQKWNCSGRVGKGVMFDGDGDNISADGTGSLNVTGAVTISAWVNLKEYGASNHNFIAGKAHEEIGVYTVTDYSLFLLSKDPSFIIADASTGTYISDSTDVQLNTWYHIVGTWDGTTNTNGVKIYTNGVRTSQGTTTITAIEGSADNFYVGTTNNAYGFNGTIDEVTVWNRSLSSEEVKQLYYSSAVSYNSTFTIQDISASNNLTQDEDNDTIKFIYDWYVDNESFAVLNMPFEAVNNGSEMNYTKDYSSNENHGSTTSFNGQSFSCKGSGATTSCSGWNRTGGVDGFGAYSFDGDSDRITLPNNAYLDLQANDDFSAFAWVKLNEQGGDYHGIFYRGYTTSEGYFLRYYKTLNRFEVKIEDSGGDRTGNSDDGIVSTTNPTVNIWYHVGFTWDRSDNTTRLYVNGIEEASATDNDIEDTSVSQNTYIGDYTTLGAADFNGTIDEVMIFNRSLSAEQIKALYYNQTQTIKSQETVKGQSWKAEVTANDGWGDSVEYNTSEIIIDDVSLEVHSIYPENMTVVHDTNTINFTYNVSDGGSVGGVTNCSLYLGYGGSHANVINSTNNLVDGTGINQTFNITFSKNITHEVRWLVGCWDKEHEQENSTEGVITFQRNELVTQSKPNIGAHAYVDRNYVVGQWRFEQFGSGAGGVFDETGINNGTISGGVKWCPDWGDSQKWNCSGRVGKGVMFDGDGDYISLTGFTDTTQTYTFSMWVKSSHPDDDLQYLFDAGTGRIILAWQTDTAGQIGFYTTSDGWNSIGDTPNDGSWHHIVGIFDGINSEFKLYKDGTQLGSTQTYTGTNIGGGVALASVNSGVSSYFNGTIDEVTIWNRSLSAEEVAQLYYSSAVSYNSTFTIQDISASNNNTADEDNDTIKFIYDWYVNNESMAVLNMPFEAVNNGSEQNFSKDYSDNENHGSTNFNSDVFESGSGWNRTGGYDGFGAYEFDGLSDWIDVSNANADIDTDFGTITVWVKGNDLDAAAQGIVSFKVGSDNNIEIYSANGADDIRLKYKAGGTAEEVVYSASDNIWYHAALTWDTTASEVKAYINGAQTGTTQTIAGSWSGSISTGYIGSTGSSHFNGTIDEVLIFNRSLSAEQIKALYYNQTQTIKSQETVKGQSWKAEVTANDGYGDSIEYNTSEIIIDSVTLKVQNQAPINYYNSSSAYVNFTFNVSDAGSVGGVINCSLWLYKGGTWQLNKTLDYPDATGINQSINITIEDANLNWTIACYDKEHEQTNSSSYNLTIDTTPPEIIIVSPLNQTYSTSIVDFNISANENLDSCKFTINDWVTNHTMTEFNSTYFNYTYLRMVMGSHTAEFWCNDTNGNINNTENVTFNVECVLPYDDMYLHENTTFCQENYDITDTNTDGVIFLNTSNIELDCNNSILNITGTALHIVYSNNDTNTIRNCIVTSSNGQGGNCYYTDTDASNNSIINNSAFRLVGDMVYNLGESTKIINNTGYHVARGILLKGGNNTVRGNTIYNIDNFDGIYVGSTGNNNTIDGNNFTNCIIAIAVFTDNNTIINNNITGNSVLGINLLGTSENNLVYNNYFDNTRNANDTGTNNLWNTTKTGGTNIIGGPYIGGNCWSDYTGLDTDRDEIGNTKLPHNSSEGIVSGGDYLPLLYPVPIIDLQAPADGYEDTDGKVSHMYNVSDKDAAVINCSLYYNTSTTGFVVKDTNTSITQVINQSINVTYTSSETINWKIGCWNALDRQGNSSTRELVISLPVVAEEEEEVAGGSSSGAGVSGDRQSSVITESWQTITGNLYSFDYMVPGTTVLEILNPLLSIYKVELDVSKELKDVELIIEEGKSNFVSKPKNRVYRYIDIKKNNLPDSAVNNIVIYFKVQKGFGDEIKLMYYQGDWRELETEEISEDVYYEYYKAGSNGMSLFAITAIDFKKSFVKIFTPELIQDVGVTGFFVRLKEYVGVSIFSFTGLICMVLLFIFVRSRLKKKKTAKAKPKRKTRKKKVKKKPKKKKPVKKKRKRKVKKKTKRKAKRKKRGKK